MKIQDWDRDTGMPIYDYDNSAKLGQAIDRIFAEHDGIDRVTMFCSLSDDLYVGRPNEGLSLGNFSITFRRPDGLPRKHKDMRDNVSETGDTFPELSRKEAAFGDICDDVARLQETLRKHWPLLIDSDPHGIVSRTSE